MTSRDRSRPLPVLEGPRLVLRPGRPGDEDALGAVFDSAEVTRWWPRPDASELEALVGNTDPDVSVWLVEVDAQVVGLLQAGEEADPMYRHAGIDIALRADMQGRGLGPEAIRLLVRHLFDERGHHRIVIDPNAANARAIRAYEKLGFRRVGVMRAYEWSEDEQRFTDGLLLDLLREELRS